MTIYVPGVMFGAGIAIFLFYEFNRKQHARRDERRESLRDTRQQYLQQMIELKRNQETVKQSPTDKQDPDGGAPTSTQPSPLPHQDRSQNSENLF